MNKKIALICCLSLCGGVQMLSGMEKLPSLLNSKIIKKKQKYSFKQKQKGEGFFSLQPNFLLFTPITYAQTIPTQQTRNALLPGVYTLSQSINTSSKAYCALCDLYIITQEDEQTHQACHNRIIALKKNSARIHPSPEKKHT